MKRYITSLAALTLACGILFADNLSFFANITNLWYQGGKSDVLSIAEDRLARDSNDLAGAIIKMEYDLEFLNLNLISNSIARVINLGQNVTTPLYSAKYPTFKADMEDILNIIATYSPTNLASDRAKALLPGKRFLFEEDLLVVCVDGLVTNFPSPPPQ